MLLQSETSCCQHHAGPVTAEAIFLNREELPIRPLYYDPIHDFGQFSCPSSLHIKLGKEHLHQCFTSLSLMTHKVLSSG